MDAAKRQSCDWPWDEGFKRQCRVRRAFRRTLAYLRIGLRCVQEANKSIELLERQRISSLYSPILSTQISLLQLLRSFVTTFPCTSVKRKWRPCYLWLVCFCAIPVAPATLQNLPPIKTARELNRSSCPDPLPCSATPIASCPQWAIVFPTFQEFVHQKPHLPDPPGDFLGAKISSDKFRREALL